MPKKKVIPPHPDKSSLAGWADAIQESSDDFHKKMKEMVLSHPEKATLLKIAKGLYREELTELYADNIPTGHVPFDQLREGRRIYFMRDALNLYETYKRIDRILKQKD